jgi:type IX secretion system PorP/SprF family membrane protein
MKAKICLIIIIVFYSSYLFSQDIHFSQFYMSPLTLNPGMAGVNSDLEVSLNYKDQWRGVTAPYKTLAASVDGRLKKDIIKQSYWTAGVNFFRDRAGDAKIGISQINITVAYQLSVAKNQTLGLGLQGGYAQRSISNNELHWSNQYDPDNGYDPNMPSGETSLINSFSYGDAGAGIVWSLNNPAGLKHVEDNHELKATLGISVFHAKQKYSFFNTSDERLYPKYVLHGNALISLPFNDNTALAPGFMFYRQGPAQELLIGSLVRYCLQQESKYTGIKKAAAMYIGAYCRTRDAFTSVFLLQYSSYTFGISYDTNFSKLSNASNGRGGIEISFRYSKSNLYQNMRMNNFR